MENEDIRGSLKLGAFVGLCNGVARSIEGGAFYKPAIQSGVIAFGIGYGLKEEDDLIQAGAIGAAMALSCQLFQGGPTSRCIRYGVVSALAAYIALGTVAAEMSELWQKYTAEKKARQT